MTRLCSKSIEIVRRMSPRELADMAGRGVEIPPDARQRLQAWQDEQDAVTRSRILAGSDFDHFTAPSNTSAPEVDLT